MSLKLSYGEFEDKHLSYLEYSRSGSSTGDMIKKMYYSLRMAAETMLTEKQRMCIIMYYEQRMTADEIANEMGVSRSSVYKHLQRARKKLFNLLKCYR